MESARVASAQDLEVLTTLGERARAEMRPKRGGDVLARLDAHALAVDDRMAGALADQSSVVAVGMVDGAPVAYGLMVVTEAADGSTMP